MTMAQLSSINSSTPVTPYSSFDGRETGIDVATLSHWEQIKLVSSWRLWAIFPYYIFAMAAPVLLVTQLAPMQEKYYGRFAAFWVKAIYISVYSILGFAASSIVGHLSDRLGVRVAGGLYR